jgi:hypothetical protein
MRCAGTVLFVVFMLAGGRAEAVSSKDILDLARAGLGEAVLLALVEVDGGVFTIDKATLTALKDAGVSERVIEAMIRSGRNKPLDLAPPPVVNPEPTPPHVIVIDHDRPNVQQVIVPSPIYIPPLTRTRARHHDALPIDAYRGFGVPFPYLQPQPQLKRAEPVYWGWGGKPRPDAWKLPATEEKSRKPEPKR